MGRFDILLIAFFLCFLTSSAFSQTDNEELAQMYKEDQSARMVEKIDWAVLLPLDKQREKRVYELFNTGMLITGKDYYRAAMIMQHGNDTLASGMAVKLMRVAIKLDTTVNKWLLAAAIDRDLMKREKPQIYGTQYIRDNEANKYKRYNMDTTQVTDAERKNLNVPTLAEQLISDREMNLLSVRHYYEKSGSIKKTIKLIKSEYKKNLRSTYNTSVNALNNFGNELRNAKNVSDALAIFKINTRLYPNSSSTYMGLAECLLALGKKDKAIEVFKRAVKVNPNSSARKRLAELAL